MKKLYFLLLALCFFMNANAQIITFTDTNFKAKLLSADVSNTTATDLAGNYTKIDVNNDNEIQVSEALQISYLDVIASSIVSLNGIEEFTNLIQLRCDSNALTNLSTHGLPNLTILYCANNQLATLDVSESTNLQELDCAYNELVNVNLTGLSHLIGFYCTGNEINNLNLSGLITLSNLYCSDNKLTTIDASELVNLKYFFCDNNQLNSLFIKNGKNESIVSFGGNSGIQFICADDSQITQIQNNISQNGYATTCTVNSYCSFTPGGTNYSIAGNTKFDSNNDGCDASDIPLSNLKINVTKGAITGSVISDASGNYFLPVDAGSYMVTPELENPSYFSISPTTVTISFPTYASPFTQNFCVTTNGVHPDLEVVIVPIEKARPGYDTKFKLIYKNKGTETQSGTVTLNFDDAVLDLVDATPVTTAQTLNNLSWNFTNLKPFETREIALIMNVNSPMDTPAVNDGDILNYTASIVAPTADETPTDNIFALSQTVVNALDPNDKTCLEGKSIAPSEVGKYVHYVIRFENNGTANAQNIVVKDIIDANKFDVNSIVPMKGSHNFITRINNNKVEFIFENINLPFDDANNDGYVAFKIKTKPTLVNGDDFSNAASIYFDYNFPIVTNTATTTIQALSVQDFNFSNYFNLYPNPVRNVLTIATKESIELNSIDIYNTLGQLLLVIPNAKNTKTIDVSSLTSGNYFIKINSDKGTSNAKFSKN